MSVAKWSIDALAKKLLEPGAFRPLLPAIFHRVAYSPDPAVILELLRLLVLLRDRIPGFPCCLESALFLPPDSFRLVFAGMATAVSRGAYPCVRFGVELLQSIYAEGTPAGK